ATAPSCELARRDLVTHLAVERDGCPMTFASLLLLPQLPMGLVGRIPLDSKLSAGENQTWVSENGTFAFGFAESCSGDGFHLVIWYAELPGDRTIVWSANRDVAVEKGAVVRFKPDGDLVLEDRGRPVWCSNTSRYGATTAAMLESGNLVIFSDDKQVAWQSSWHPTDTLLPGQPLNASLELASPRTPLGYYSLKMLQRASSLTLALSYISQESDPTVPESYANYTYWSGPQISNATGDIAAMLDKSGNFVITYGASAAGTVYIHTNDTAGSALHQRRLKIEPDGNLRLYRWDGPGGGWVTEWSAVSNPCEVAGICGNGICSLDGRKTLANCSCPPGTSRARFKRGGCSSDVLSPPPRNCTNSSTTGAVRMATMSQTNYYFSGPSILANHSNVNSSSQCSDYCLSDCRCVAAVHGLSQGDAQCWTLRHLVFGGFQDPSSTLFMKVGSNDSLAGTTPGIGRGRAGGSSSDGSNRNLALFLPLVLCFSVLAALMSLLLYCHISGKRLGRLRTLSRCLTVPGAPLNFTYQELQAATSNFSQTLGTGGFGTVYKGSLGDGTLVAVKKLEKMLPHGEREFITEVTTIGSMHHMNLVRLCGFCSEGSHRLLVYEYMSNGSLDQWIFPSRWNPGSSRLLDWRTRFRVAADIAQGIAYFHEQCRDRIIHCDIKPENILLDENFCPKVSDFGLAKLMGREHSHVVTMVRGTRGYLAPEWVSNRPVTVKADVYSYGMVLLEIIGGRRNLDMSLDAEDFFYPGWAFKELMGGNPVKAADKRLQGEVVEEEVVRALNAAFWCIQEDVCARPTMGEVIRILEGSAEVRVPPVPQAVVEIMEEGLSNVYKAMRRSYLVHQLSSSAAVTRTPSSQATCSYSTMSPR
ncbi:hypothetical protein Taro_027416, partial [Colocasia esculenta]|nr:hypothetical protein [Colocasia esculenta]